MGKIKMDLMTNMKVNEILMFKVLNSFYFCGIWERQGINDWLTRECNYIYTTKIQ